MKKMLILLALLPAMLMAQRPNVMDELKADPKKSYGNDYPYLFQPEQLTAAPEGYKPFYISHYGRHGSRYYWSDKLYQELDTLMKQAGKLHLLTAEGEAFRKRFNDALPELNARWGELSEAGWQQHQNIAAAMANNFPEIFQKGKHVTAVSSLQGRCVISMASFCLELKQHCPWIEIRQESSRTTLDAVVPDDRQNPNRKDFPTLRPRYEQSAIKVAQDESLNQRILNRMFKSAEGLSLSPQQIVDDLKNMYTSLVSIGHEGMMGSIVTDEDMLSQWEVSNLGSYSWVFGPQLRTIPILNDILSKAEAAINGTNEDVANLRFGHDSYLGPLTVLMGINGSDKDPEDPREVKYIYQNFETCKAGNIQLVFYRNAQNDVLVKCVLNGREASLPVPTTQFPYYRWTDFQGDMGTGPCPLFLPHLFSQPFYHMFPYASQTN